MKADPDPERTIYTDVFGEEVTLTESARTVILAKHPEATDFIERVERVLAEPDEVRRSASDERTALYYHYAADVLDGKWLVVVVKQAEGKFISTMYATDKIKSGDVLWKK